MRNDVRGLLALGEVFSTTMAPDPPRESPAPNHKLVFADAGCEVWAGNGEVVILGQPDGEDEEEDGHNCDAMGCGTAHVVARWRYTGATA